MFLAVRQRGDLSVHVFHLAECIKEDFQAIRLMIGSSCRFPFTQTGVMLRFNAGVIPVACVLDMRHAE